MLLIIDNNEMICQYFPSPNKFVDATTLSITDLLLIIKNEEQLTKIYFPLELKCKHGARQQLNGLDLFKHIRLSSELGNRQFAPVLLGFTGALEKILLDADATLLCSPGTRLVNLKEMNQIRFHTFFLSDEKITREILYPYVLFNNNDENATEHDSRNLSGPILLEDQFRDETDNRIGFSIRKKKMLFLQSKADVGAVDKIENDEFKRIVKRRKILYIDDEATKWKDVLLKIFTGANLVIENNFDSINDRLEEAIKTQDEFLKNFSDEDHAIHFGFRNQDEMFPFLKNDLQVAEKARHLLSVFPFDLIVLDLRLNKPKDDISDIEEMSGYYLIKKIRELNPFIPIIVFSASNKIRSYKKLISAGAYGYWIKGISSYEELKILIHGCLGKRLPEKILPVKQKTAIPRERAFLQLLFYKVLMIKNRRQLFCFNDLDQHPIGVKPIEGYNLTLVYRHLAYMLEFVRDVLQKKDAPSLNDLWLNTNGLNEIRLPGCKGRPKHRKIIGREELFRQERNDRVHNEPGRNDLAFTLDYIENSIDFLLACRT